MFSPCAIYQWSNPTALMLGEFENFSAINVKQVKKYIKDVGQVCIQVTNTSSDPDVFNNIKGKIQNKLDEVGLSYNAKYIILEVPNITITNKL
jgi:hypothetical protein